MFTLASSTPTHRYCFPVSPNQTTLPFAFIFYPLIRIWIFIFPVLKHNRDFVLNQQLSDTERRKKKKTQTVLKVLPHPSTIRGVYGSRLEFRHLSYVTLAAPTLLKTVLSAPAARAPQPSPEPGLKSKNVGIRPRYVHLSTPLGF